MSFPDKDLLDMLATKKNPVSRTIKAADYSHGSTATTPLSIRPQVPEAAVWLQFHGRTSMKLWTQSDE